MSFPHARKGIKLLLTAQVMMIIVSALILVGTVLAQISTTDTNLAIGGLIVLVAALAMFVAGIIDFVGYCKSARDDKNFVAALIFVILGILVSVVSGVLNYLGKSTKLLSDLLPAIGEFFQELTIIFAVLGLCSLSKKMGDEKNIRYGKSLCGVIVAIFCIWAAINVVLIVLTDITALIAGILALVEGVMILVSYFMYLTYLGKVSRMLK